MTAEVVKMNVKPNLPVHTEWPPETREWFKAWRDSPRTDTWDDAQWQYLFDTAVVHSLVYAAQQFQYLQELRVREQAMGLSFAPMAEAPKRAEVTPIEQIRRRHAEGPRRKVNV